MLKLALESVLIYALSGICYVFALLFLCSWRGVRSPPGAIMFLAVIMAALTATAHIVRHTL